MRGGKESRGFVVMKVLQVNCVYKKGSTGKIVADIHTELIQRGIESVVCYGRGVKVQEENVYKICGELYSHANHFMANATGVMYGGCNLSTRKLIKIIKKENPDVVHLQCINGYFVNIYRLVEWLKATRIRTVLTLHAEFMYTGGCGHSIDCNQWSTREGCGHSINCPRWRTETSSWFFDRTATMWQSMKNAFEGFNDRLIVTSVSPWLMQRAQQSPILGGKEHRVILNGVNPDVFHLRNCEELRRKYSPDGETVLFHATPNFNLDPNHIKGGYYINELAKGVKEKNVKVIVAGFYKEDISVSDNVILLGRVQDQKKLAEYYSMADLTILTSKKETFSMVTAESLSCGTPIVGFMAGGPEQIAMDKYSNFVEYGDISALKSAVLSMLDMELDKPNISKEAIAKYGKDVMCNSYIEIYKELCNK